MLLIVPRAQVPSGLIKMIPRVDEAMYTSPSTLNRAVLGVLVPTLIVPLAVDVEVLKKSLVPLNIPVP